MEKEARNGRVPVLFYFVHEKQQTHGSSSKFILVVPQLF